MLNDTWMLLHLLGKRYFTVFLPCYNLPIRNDSNTNGNLPFKSATATYRIFTVNYRIVRPVITVFHSRRWNVLGWVTTEECYPLLRFACKYLCVTNGKQYHIIQHWKNVRMTTEDKVKFCCVSQHARQRNAVSRMISQIKAKPWYLSVHHTPILSLIDAKLDKVNYVADFISITPGMAVWICATFHCIG